MTPRAYPDILRAAWDAHLAPKPADAPTVASSFAGAGGSTLGYSMAGFREVLAIEWEDHAASCYRRNFPEAHLIHGDIAGVDPDVLGLARGELDVWDGSPPCQGFSTNGHRDLDDPRNQLFREYVRLLDAWAPKVFVMENVPSMAKGTTRTLFVEILRTLRASGYRVIAREVDASLLGVPQKRKRMIFVGVREDIGIDPPFPRPQRRVFTVGDAIRDLGPDDLGLVKVPGGKYAEASAHIPQGRAMGDVLREAGRKDSLFSLKRLHAARPANTIAKTVSDVGGLLHPTKHRFISSGEACRLQSFPDAYDWGDSTYQQIIARVGNSVPPLMMRAIAEAIRAEVLDKL